MNRRIALGQPDFLGIGATKAGTSWLHAQLSTHPDVCMPIIKELHYFDSIGNPTLQMWTRAAVSKALRRAMREIRRQDHPSAKDQILLDYAQRALTEPPFTPEWYQMMLERPDRNGRLVGEITPAYAELISDKRLERMSRNLPETKVIYILRHPVDRALSHLRMAAYRAGGDASETSLHELIDRQAGILSRGACERYLPRWMRYFENSRMKVMPYGEIKRSPRGFMREVESFLGLAPFDGYDLESSVNATRSIDIPSSIHQRLTREVADTLDYIQKYFGPEFLEASR